MKGLPKSVEVRDDTMREGLQIESKDIPVDEKLRLLDALGETGTKVISIGSFVSPKWTPQMACIDEIAERFEPKPGVTYTAAVFNQQGFERADKYYPKINVRMREYMTHVEVGKVFALRNYNRSPAQMLAQGDSTIDRAQLSATARTGFPETASTIGAGGTIPLPVSTTRSLSDPRRSQMSPTA